MSANRAVQHSSQSLSHRHHGNSIHGRHESEHGGHSNATDKVLGIGVILLVIFSALAHGTVEPWSIALFELASTLLIIIWVVGAIVARRLTLRLPRTLLPLIALLVIAAIQSTSVTAGDGRRLSLSLDVEATRSSLLVLFCLAALVALAGNYLTSKERLKSLAKILAIFGFALALFALLQRLSWNGRFYWVRPNTQGASPFGPFVNHNNFAGYMELLIPIPLALALTGAVRGETRLFYGFAAAVMSVACIASLSRGGMISLFAGILFLFLMKRKLRGLDETEEPHRGILSLGWRFGVPALILASIAGGVIWIASDSVVTRVMGQTAAGTASGETFSSSRGWLWRDTIRIIEAKPILGVGFGAYATAYPIFIASDGSLLVDRADNDYLQIVADCGVFGGAVAIWFVVIFWKGFFGAILSHDRFLAAMSLGCGSAVFALLVHSIFDFNLQLPSNALLFLLLSSIPMMVSSHMVRAKGKARVVLKRPEQTEFLPRLRGDAPLPPAENAETLNSASEN